MSERDTKPEDWLVTRHKGYEHVSFWRISCEAECGAYLAGEEGSWFATPHKRYAATFPTQSRAWQAAMAAKWADVPLPGHDPHMHGPYGQGEYTFYCRQNGAGDCQEVREYKEAIMCPACRDAGRFPW